jgi:hypothetical protein
MGQYNGSGRTRLTGYDCKDRTAKTGLLGQNCQNRTARIRQDKKRRGKPIKTARTEQPLTV